MGARNIKGSRSRLMRANDDLYGLQRMCAKACLHGQDLLEDAGRVGDGS